MDLADAVSVLREAGTRGASDLKGPLMVVAVVLGIIYLVAGLAAVLYGDEKRRTDARRVLMLHKFTRKTHTEDRQEIDEGVE